MNKTLLIVSFLLLTLTSFSQSSVDDVQFVNVSWEVGESKTVSQVDSTVIYGNGSVFMATGVKSKFTIEIINKKDTIYEVLFKQIVLDDNLSVESELINASPIEQMMQDLLLDLQTKISGLEYSFLVDQNTAMAFEVKNEAKLIEHVEEMVVIVLNQFFDQAKIDLDESQKKELKLYVKQYMDEQMPAAMQTMLNAFNYIFQAYSFPFILDDTYTQEIEVYSIDQIQHADKENTAKLVVKGAIRNNLLNIDYEYVYDKQQAYEMYVVAEGKGDEISIEEFDIEERVATEFDMETSWIKTSSSFVNAIMGEITVTNSTHVVIE